MILPECRWMWEGVEGADSLVLNPHKWLGAAFDCSLYYVRDPRAPGARDVDQPELSAQSPSTSEVKKLRDWGIPLGRRFRALKLWCLIREQGVEGLQARLRRDLDNARWLADEVRARAGLARARAGAAADGLRAPRAAGARGRGARPPHARLGRARQPIGRGLPDAGDARRPLDGARVDRRAADRARHVEALWALVRNEAEGGVRGAAATDLPSLMAEAVAVQRDANSCAELLLDRTAIEPDVLAADEVVLELEDVQDTKRDAPSVARDSKNVPGTLPVIIWSMIIASPAKYRREGRSSSVLKFAVSGLVESARARLASKRPARPSNHIVLDIVGIDGDRAIHVARSLSFQVLLKRATIRSRSMGAS